MLMIAAPASTFQPFNPTGAPGFQKIDAASWHGEPVTANPRDAAHVPVSLMPNACACATSGTAKASNAITATDSMERCRCISILRLFGRALGNALEEGANVGKRCRTEPKKR